MDKITITNGAINKTIDKKKLSKYPGWKQISTSELEKAEKESKARKEKYANIKNSKNTDSKLKALVEKQAEVIAILEAKVTALEAKAVKQGA